MSKIGIGIGLSAAATMIMPSTNPLTYIAVAAIGQAVAWAPDLFKLKSAIYRNMDVQSATINGDLARLNALLANGPISAETRGIAVKCAARNGHLPLVEALLANGAIISEQDRGKIVIQAARNGDLPTVNALLANGAIISEEHFNRALAAGNEHIEVVEFLIWARDNQLLNRAIISEKRFGPSAG